jgi:hypothetical protein
MKISVRELFTANIFIEMLESILAIAIFTSFSAHAEPVPDPAQVRAFKRRNICPGTGNLERLCRGYVVEHVIPIACGGLDISENMRYIAVEVNLGKDRIDCPVKRKPK